ncbi:MAG: phosphoenolpyruvate synthase [Porphyromonadaceae bacterium CG2_30_38_12]|nr:MAG: phosphoenolpyruvate synthase [Porphyromonadaceae bacterium CG2_30_38_12]
MNTLSIKKLYFKDTSFANLMHHRIYNVLLFASKYDAFVLEEDGRIDEQLFNEYTSLNLRYPPRFMLVSSEDEANELLQTRSFELIISMPSGDSINPFEWAKGVKSNYPDIPIVVLTPFSKSVSQRISNEDLSAVDYVFSWLGNTDLLLAIIKLLEDKMNVDEDVQSVGVQVILLVEDSIRFYSSIVPQLYKYVFKQSRSFMTEALNAHEQMLRMRGRPKILLARNYEEAVDYYNRFKNNVLGVISDVSFYQNGKKNKQAGIAFGKYIRLSDQKLPLIIESTDDVNRAAAATVNAAFINKFSKTFHIELREMITNYFGFGDFVFIHPETGKEEGRIQNLRGLQEILYQLSDETLLYNVSRNNISRWLYSRAMFPLAEFLKNISVENYQTGNLNPVRDIIFNAIVSYRKIKNRGIVAIFQRDRFDQYSNFARIGDGSMGGKGRGLAFIDAMIKRNEVLEEFENVQITIPQTVVICTDIFTDFMELNKLYPIALSDVSNEEVLQHFLKANMPKRVIADLTAFVNASNAPIAVRSSSLLEDSHYQPFAGIYTTYMVPFNRQSKSHLLLTILEAIKAVYASVFYTESKAYMAATNNVIDEEKMAVVLQEICGAAHGNIYYPSFSGVTRSLNYYPIGAEQTSEGITNIAFGLGKYIMDGGLSLRFSPAHPYNVLQTSTMELTLKETQRYFNALDLCENCFIPKVEDGFNILNIPVQEAEKDGTLKFIASTYDVYNDTINDTLATGRKVITFANILKHDVFPLAKILQTVMRIAQDEMGRPIEIEFAVNLEYDSGKVHNFYLLQIRPIVDMKEIITEKIDKINTDDTLISSKNALGHGIISDIQDIIYVKPEAFNASNNNKIAVEIEILNKQLVAEGRHYILVGPGRWGSNDSWLGIPVKWAHISNARIIVESGLSNYRIDPSQGTHFFQNLTSLGVAYLTINPFQNDGTYQVDYLNEQHAVYESDFIRHVRFEKALVVKIDGRKKLGVVMKP